MRFLKKASLEDILGANLDDLSQKYSFHELKERSITSRYKDIELFLTRKTLKQITEEPGGSQALDNLLNILKYNQATISAVHVPESRFLTDADFSDSISTNALSLCEVLRDEDSYITLEKTLELAVKLHPGKDEKKVFVIIHGGCPIGCTSKSERKPDFSCDTDPCWNRLSQLLTKKSNSDAVTLVLENITPFTDNFEDTCLGKNCHWQAETFFSFLQHANKKLGLKNKIGICLDICHIFACEKLYNKNSGSQNTIYSVRKFLQKGNILDSNGIQTKISMIHLSNYGASGVHGEPFTTKDDELVNNLRILLENVAPSAPITLEVAGGSDFQTGCRNFEHMMLAWSKVHTSGCFGKLLGMPTKDCPKGSELWNFFDALYQVYSMENIDPYQLRRYANQIREFILKHRTLHKKNGFNLHNNQTFRDAFWEFGDGRHTYDSAVFRLQAYIFYVRYCHLGQCLATYYSETNCFIEHQYRADDFQLAMQYFMFHDALKQVQYSGIHFCFNVDFLPRRETLFRFYDSYTSLNIFVQ